MAKKRKKVIVSPISFDTVRHVANLARLSLTEQEVKQFQKDLGEILQAFKKLDRAKTDNIAPSFHPAVVKDVLREDVQEECLPQEKALENTAHKERGSFKGPRVV